jgi:hypothetical protein
MWGIGETCRYNFSGFGSRRRVINGHGVLRSVLTCSASHAGRLANLGTGAGADIMTLGAGAGQPQPR